jgi:hypothetical protein
MVAIVSCDEKPGIQAIATTAPDLPPAPGRQATFARDHDLKASRHGQLAGRHRSHHRPGPRSRQGPPPLAHDDQADARQSFCAHLQETKAWLAEQPTGRFEFTFTPKHGSWLNLVEGFFSKLARSVLRRIRVASKQELKERIMAAMDEFNRHPVIHTWSYKLDYAA